MVLSFYAAFIRQPDWNINSRLGLVKAIVEEKRLTIDSYHAGEFATEDKAFYDGHYYSDKAPVTSLLGALIYTPIYRSVKQPLPISLFIMLMTTLTISIPCAILAPLLYNTSIRISRDKWFALIAALSIALATPIFPYAGAFYGHSFAAVLAFSVFYLWLDVNQFGASITYLRLFLSGLLLGFMVLTEYTTVLIAAILLGYIIYVLRAKQATWNWNIVGSFLAGGAIPFAVFVIYNQLSFGSPLAIGYANESLVEFKDLHSEGLMGIGWPNLKTLLYMTVHPLMGIFLQAPVLLLSVYGFAMFLRQRKYIAELIVSALIIIVYFLVVSSLKVWWGGNSFTVRYIIPILPFFIMFLVFLPRKYILFMILLGSVSFFNMLIASATTYTALDDIVREHLIQENGLSWKFSLLYQELLPRLLKNRLTLTWGGYIFGLESWYFNLALPLLAGGLLFVLFFLLNRSRKKSLTTASAPETINPNHLQP